MSVDVSAGRNAITASVTLQPTEPSILPLESAYDTAVLTEDSSELPPPPSLPPLKSVHSGKGGTTVKMRNRSSLPCLGVQGVDSHVLPIICCNRCRPRNIVRALRVTAVTAARREQSRWCGIAMRRTTITVIATDMLPTAVALESNSSLAV